MLFPGDTPFSEFDLDARFSLAMIHFELGDLSPASQGFNELLVVSKTLLDQRRELEQHFEDPEVEVDLHLLQDVIRAREYALLAERFLAEISNQEGGSRSAAEHYRRAAEQAFAMQAQTGWNRRLFDPVTDIYVSVARLTDAAGQAVADPNVVDRIERFLTAYLAHYPRDFESRLTFAAALNAARHRSVSGRQPGSGNRAAVSGGRARGDCPFGSRDTSAGNRTDDHRPCCFGHGPLPRWTTPGPPALTCSSRSMS